MKTPTHNKSLILLISCFLLAAYTSCNQKTESKHNLNVEDPTAPIRYGFRGEGLYYRLNGEEYELWSTWGEERSVVLDDLDETNLSDEEKTQMFKDIIAFVIQSDKSKPVFYYNEDLESSTLWRKLCSEFADQIERVEVTNTKQKNMDYYNQLVDLLQHEGTEIHVDEFIIKSVEELDQHWEEIKIQQK
ncbi:MAG: hypothetical protein AAF598_09995 [Bacteroidota bacterium]